MTSMPGSGIQSVSGPWLTWARQSPPPAAPRTPVQHACSGVCVGGEVRGGGGDMALSSQGQSCFGAGTCIVGGGRAHSSFVVSRCGLAHVCHAGNEDRSCVPTRQGGKPTDAEGGGVCRARSRASQAQGEAAHRRRRPSEPRPASWDQTWHSTDAPVPGAYGTWASVSGTRRSCLAAAG